MATVNVYLNFNGNCEAAFTFYKSVFGGEFAYIGKFKDMPAQGDNACKPEDENKIMHVSLPVSQETILMGSDIMEGYGPPFVAGTNFSVSINANSQEEADNLFKGLSEGGHVVMPLADTFWGAYFGMFVDKFGINWMVNYDRPQPQA